jgi:MoaA/NifB/PqqE/SkfB family radical SAM enzyme
MPNLFCRQEPGLTPEPIRKLNPAGLDHLQISIDNVLPDEVSRKSLNVLGQETAMALRARGIRRKHQFRARTIRNPDDAFTIARRAREPGFQSTVRLIHDCSGRLRQLDEHQRAVFRAISNLSKPVHNSALYKRFYENLAQGRPNDWHCRAGSRYLYICEDGLVRYCSQQRGHPGPLEEYTRENLEHEYHTVKPCAPHCTIPCVQRVAMVDEFRESPKEALLRFFPVCGHGDQTSSDFALSHYAFSRGCFYRPSSTIGETV